MLGSRNGLQCPGHKDIKGRNHGLVFLSTVTEKASSFNVSLDKQLGGRELILTGSLAEDKIEMASRPLVSRIGMSNFL